RLCAAAALANMARGPNLKSRVPGLPSDGRTLYVRIWSLIAGEWRFNDYPYSAPTRKAQMVSPVPGTFLSGPITFHWAAGIGASQYWIYVGRHPGEADLVYGAGNVGSALSYTFTGGVNVPTLYVRLWSLVDGVWQFNDYVYPNEYNLAVITT